MNLPKDQDADALQTALHAVRENERRWLEMSAEFYSDSERMEQWRSIAKLRRLETERIEALLAGKAERLSLPNPGCGIAIETKNRLGETA